MEENSSCIVTIVVGHGLVMQGARASAAMVLSLGAQNTSVSLPEYMDYITEWLANTWVKFYDIFDGNYWVAVSKVGNFKTAYILKQDI